MFHSIQVIAFDLDDTLWPCRPTIQRAENATYDWLRQNYPRITDSYSKARLLELRKRIMHSRPELEIDLSLMRRQMLTELAREHDYPEQTLVQEGFELFYRLRHDVDFYRDVFPVLDRLKPRYRLGSISNGNASAGLTPLDDYFEHYLNAADVMVRKPDAGIFHAFCESMQIDPEHCLYVGDDPVYDVHGGREAGMRTVWVNRESGAWPAEIEPADAEISDLEGLLGLL